MPRVGENLKSKIEQAVPGLCFLPREVGLVLGSGCRVVGDRELFSFLGLSEALASVAQWLEHQPAH